MLKKALGVSAALALLLVSTGAFARPPVPRSASDHFNRVGRPDAEQVQTSRRGADKSSVRATTRHATRTPKALDTRRSRGELWDSGGAAGHGVRRGGAGTAPAGTAPRAISERRVNAVANCSELSSCGSSARGSSASSGATRASADGANRDSYKRKVFLNKMEKLQRMLGIPDQACGNGTDCWLP